MRCPGYCDAVSLWGVAGENPHAPLCTVASIATSLQGWTWHEVTLPPLGALGACAPADPPDGRPVVEVERPAP